MKFHIDGSKPQNGEIFVFGSNEAGIHGAGAAREALENYGAVWGDGFWFRGQSYAIPTKDREIITLPFYIVKHNVERFLMDSRAHQEFEFFVTRIGCGLAGYKNSEIAPMFSCAPNNCNMPIEWKEWMWLS